MPDYQKGKIYKLWSPQGEEDEIYIGSTTDKLYKRKNQHKKKANNCKSKILFEKYDDIRIELIEDYPCNSKAELEKKEGEYIRNNKCINTNIPDRKMKEYYLDNKERIQKYAENNKDKIAEYQKKYHEDNKEAVSEKKKEYYENNKEYFHNYYNKKITCDCGCFTSPNNLARHQKTPKHIKLMEEKNNNI